MCRYNIIVGGILIALCCVLAGPLVDRGVAAPPAGYAPTFSDEFDGTSLSDKWNVKWFAEYWEGRVNRDGIYTMDAVSVSNGNLVMQTYTENGTHYSGMVKMKDQYYQKYGYFEVRARFINERSGQWNAFYMMPESYVPGPDPADGTEIDIFEHRRADPGNNNINHQVHQAVLWDSWQQQVQNQPTFAPLDPPYIPNWESSHDLVDEEAYHTYGLRWGPSSYEFYIDGDLTWTCTTAVSKANQSVMFSKEVGHNFAGSIPSGGYGDRNTSTTLMLVDYIRAYAVVPEPGTLLLLAIAGLSLLGYVWRKRR